MAEYKVHHFTTRDSNDRWQIVDKVGREYVAKQFNTNYSYEINEYCVYNNALYKFIQRHNAGIWNNQHVILCANLASELTSIKNDINNSNNNINTLSGEITNIQNEVRSSISDVMDRVDDAKDEIEDDVRDSINIVVTDWLDLHVNTDEGQTSIVDDTLTIQGAAADAKAAGDAISALSDGLNNIQTGTSTDIGKALSPKTVSNNKVTEWQYVSVGGGGGGAVDSVNGQTGTVVLDAGDLEYDDEETYTSGTVGKEISNLKDGYTDLDNRVTALEQGGGSGLTSDIKQALLQLAAKVAYVDDDGQDYYDDLHDALYTLVSISAVYTQSGTVYTSDSLDSLKSDLVVTALYDDQSMATVTSYTLSGTLTAGTSTITVSYGGKTTTFTVTVTAATLSSISAVYTQSGTVYETDSLDSLKTDLVVTAHWSDNTTSTVASADYTLSGTLTVGTSTITVSYGGKTTTFNVVVSGNWVDITGDMRNWHVPSQQTITNITEDGMTFNGTASASWGIVTFQSPLSITTQSVQGKTVQIEFDLSVSGYVSGAGIVCGIASFNRTNPDSGSQRTKYIDDRTTEGGHHTYTFDVTSENVDIANNRYLGVYIYWNASDNAVATISNFTFKCEE